jgi:hypothetical protein
MANTLTPFGLRHAGYLEGAAPTYGLRRRKIALGNTNPIFHGDPVTSINTGYIAQSVQGAAVQWAGVFSHCEYFSVSQQRKVRSNYWPGSDAQFDPDAFIIDAGNAYFIAACDGGPITFASVDKNIDVTIATGGSATPTAGSGQGNTVAQLSGALLRFASIGTTNTLPLRIIRLYSDDVVPGAPTAGGTGVNGADNTTSFNWAVVGFNNVDTRALTGIS